MKEADKANEGASHHEVGWREALEMRLSRRSLLAGAAATAAFSIIGLPRKGAAAETPLQILTGPVLPAVNSAYDVWQLAQVPKTIAGFNADPLALDPTLAKSTIGSWNFYDLALSAYLLYYRTGNTAYRTAARTVAAAWRDNEYCANIPLFNARNYSLEVPPSRQISSLGLAVHYLDTGEALSRARVEQMAILWRHLIFDGHNADMRESGYALMALVASTLLGDDHRADALAILNAFLTAQKSDGRWENIDRGSQVPAIYYTLNYMVGLVMEALIMYDRAFGDARIVPALQRCVDTYLWRTQWVPVVPTSRPAFGAFQYANINSGTVNTNPYANLSGLLVPAWGYLYAKTGGAKYKTQGDTILAGMVAGGAQPGIPGSGIYNEKQSNQEFRSSPGYLGWTGGTTGQLSAPSKLVVQ